MLRRGRAATPPRAQRKAAPPLPGPERAEGAPSGGAVGAFPRGSPRACTVAGMPASRLSPDIRIRMATKLTQVSADGSASGLDRIIAVRRVARGDPVGDER